MGNSDSAGQFRRNAAATTPIRLAGVAAHPGGKLRVELAARGEFPAATVEIPTLWISEIAVEPDLH